MCGIAGILGANAERQRAVISMTDAIAHRGPDDVGYFHDDRISLGQRRLSIIDLKTGHQPITNETDDIVLICNGEIYNSPDLRRDLIARGHVFKTSTDVETIIHLYEEYGSKCVHHLRGMFSFVIWDQKNKSLLLARDHLGQKPLYFASVDGAFVFASEVKAILATNWLGNDELNVEGIWHYVSMRFLPDQHSFFNSVHKLPAAHTLTWKDGAHRVEKYWDPDFTTKLGGSESDIVAGLHDVLNETVGMHLLSDVRVGAFLSGGIDSSTIAAMMANHIKEPVPVFSIGVKEQSYNELPYARMVAEKYDMEAHEQVVSADLIHLIPSMIRHLDEPSDPYGVGVYLVSKIARENVKVVLSGDGGDENFAGYDRYAGQRFADYYAILPKWIRRRVMRRLIKFIPESFKYKTMAQKARWLNEVSLFDRGERYAHSLSFLRFTQEGKQRLFTDRACAQVEVENSDLKIMQYFDAANADDLVDRMLYTDLMTRMPDHLMVIADRMTMAHSLESRAPLLDHVLVQYAASIPSELKLNGSKLKYALKRVADRYLPRELIYRKKQGFGFPIALWMRTELADFLRNLFRQSRFVELGLFQQREMDRLLDEHLSGQVDHNFRLWILLNLELWYRMYFENMGLEEMQELTSSLSQRQYLN